VDSIRVWKIATRLGAVLVRWKFAPALRDPGDASLHASAVRHLLFEIDGRTPTVLAELEELWRDVNGGEPLAHRFQAHNALDEARRLDALSRFVETEVRSGRLQVEFLPLPALHVRPEVEPPPPPLPPRGRSPAKEKTFIAVQLVDQRGQPVPGRRFEIDLPDGSKRQGVTDARGWGGVDDFTLDGEAKIRFPAFDELDHLSGTSAKKIIIPISDEAAPVAAAPASGPAPAGSKAAPPPEQRPLAAGPAPPVPPPAVAALAQVIEPTLFRFKVVDESGAALDGVGLDLTINGERQSLTSALGLASTEVSAPTKGIATLSDVAETRRLLEARRPLEKTQPLEGDGVRVLAASVDGEPAAVESGNEHTLVVVLPPRKVSVVEVEDGMFRLDSAVVLPEAERPSADEHEALTLASVFTSALLFATANVGKKLLVAGHTDTSGTESHNQELSEARAACALACLSGDREGFARTCDERHLVSDYKQILSWAAAAFGFSCAPDKIDDVEFTGIAPIKAFQSDYNANRAALGVPDAEELKVDGSMGEKTWGAVFDCYEAALALELSEGETPAERLADLGELRKDLVFVDDSKKAQGFGEHHTVDQIGRDSVRSQQNRRVELLFFGPGEEPDLSQPPKDSEIYAPGEYVRELIDAETAARAVELRLCDPLGDPIPKAACTITIGQQLKTKEADDQGRVILLLPPRSISIFADWTDPEDPDGVVFSRELFMSIDAADEGSRRRLHNLGYEAETVDEQLEAFRVDFGRADEVPRAALLNEASAWHNGGNRPNRTSPAS
jgi:outer membrane protein OmpA-like peptidoglycan-associated protein